ncbi:tetratricopeptide repeat protein [Brachyspira aalborgi]|uniref:Tetratricopeptide repeat protein n=1 Tax=Brachyspira aalborgi TaxID=29522 RepID=A0A5C8FS10_9SPIR|nr:tetratricopeptide repeat protein [Brachyspira aalborgi]TXJ52443.1 tetratricopeptide repeat protein [Brachyspira aalborgi]
MLSREEIEKEINLGNFEYVIEKCNECINLKYDYSFLYNYRGLCKNNLGLYEEAIKDFDISIELNKEFENKPYAINRDLANAYYYRGLSKNNLKEYNEAIEDFKKSLKFEPAYWLVVHYNIGVSKINLGEYEESIKNFDIITYQNIYKGYYNRIIRKEIYDNELYNTYVSMHCSILFAKLLLKEKAYNSINMFLELSKCFNPNNNHIFNMVSFLFENYKYDLIEKIFNYLVEENYNDLWENDITFNLLKSKTIDKEILKNIKKNLLYQYLLLQSLSFNNKTLKREFTYNIEIAHYTSLNILLKLIKEDNKIRITNISNANDPKEGKILENILNKNKLDIKIKNDENLITLQTSLSRNKDALTMFRLYGKNENKEATGICLVIDKKYFNDNYLSPVIEVNLDNQKQEEKKGNENYKKAKEIIQKRFERKNLYWVIYYNEEKNQLVFNPTKSKYSSVIIDLNTINKNKKNINKIEDLINCIFHNIINSAKEIDKIENKNLKDEIFSNLFENIRYIIKHEAFFEEQELRMLITTDYKNENINIEEDKKRLYINYNELFNENENFIKEIILGGKIEDKELTADYIKQIIYNKYKDNDKMNKIKVSISHAPLR